jgi:hypothetical protein
MLDRRPPPTSDQANLSVGGPSGIQLRDQAIVVDGRIMTTTQSGAAGATERRTAESVELAGVTAALARHSGAASAALLVSGVLALVGPATILIALGLPLALMVVPGVAGLGMLSAALVIHKRARERRGEVDVRIEHQLLEFAVQQQGRVTVGAAARALGISMAEADDALTSLARAGHVYPDNDPETGVVVYMFPELAPRFIGKGSV